MIARKVLILLVVPFLCFPYVIPVPTQKSEDKIQQACKVRNDEWAETVLGRLEFAQDLHAAEAVYRQACISTFGRENIFRRSMGIVLIQSVQRDDYGYSSI